MSRTDEMLTIGEIAQALGVEQPAVSNWRRRYPDFPVPTTVDGKQLFAIEELISWLDRRPIPTRSLTEQESPGSTYGDRLRSRPTRSAPVGSPRDDDDAIPAVIDSYRDLPRRAEMDYVALLLAYLKAVDGRAWAGIVEDADLPDQVRKRIEKAVRENLDLTAADVVDNLARTVGWTSAFGRVTRAIDRNMPTAEGPLQTGTVFKHLLAHIAEERDRYDGSFFLPSAITELAVELLQPRCGDSVHDPCCGTGGFLTAAADHLIASGCSSSELSLSGQAESERLYLLTTMNLQIRGIKASIRAGSYEPRDEQFDIVLTNPPFNARYDPYIRPEHAWPFGPPPKHNANFGWLQHAYSLLAPGGRAIVVMSPSAAHTMNGRELAVRSKMVEAGAVEAIIGLPDHLFHGTAIPVHLWLLTREPRDSGNPLLLVDASGLGSRTGRRNRVLSWSEIASVKDAVSRWRTLRPSPIGSISDIAVAVSIDVLAEHRFDLNPRAYVPHPIVQSSSVETTDRIASIVEELRVLHATADDVDADLDRRLAMVIRDLADR